ncbi:hypothetical protein D3C86_1883760 [compost metagenome]
MLPGIVEYRRQLRLAIGEGDDLFQRLAGQVPILLHEAVERGHIGLVVLVVMQLQRFLAHAAFGEGSVGIGQGGKFKGHFLTPGSGAASATLAFDRHAV